MPLPNVWTRCFTRKRCIAFDGAVGGRDMHPSGVQFGLLRGLLRRGGQRRDPHAQSRSDRIAGAGLRRFGRNRSSVETDINRFLSS